MNLRKFLRRSHLYAGLEKDLERLHVRLLKVKARIVILRYHRDHAVRKLQIGAGPTQSEGWLTTDIAAKLRRRTIYLDATQPLPFADASIDYVFSEHMIEHIPYPATCALLKECFRILKPGGRIRLATPDLGQILALRNDHLSDSQREYIAWSTRKFLPSGTPEQAIHVINNQFRNYGHEFLFDERSLREAMTEAGFAHLERFAVGQSDDAQLIGIERHGFNIGSETMNIFETMVLEGDAEVLSMRTTIDSLSTDLT